MTSKQQLEAQMLLDDPRYEAWRAGLNAELEKRVDALLRPGKDHARMSRLAGEASALRVALGLRAELEKTEDPVSPDS